MYEDRTLAHDEARHHNSLVPFGVCGVPLAHTLFGVSKKLNLPLTKPNVVEQLKVSPPTELSCLARETSGCLEIGAIVTIRARVESLSRGKLALLHPAQNR